MAKSFISKRMHFPRAGLQKLFLESVIKRITLAKTVRLANVSSRTLLDWRREKYSLPYITALRMAEKSRVSLPSGSSVRSLHAHLGSFASKGGRMLYQKYAHVGGDERKRLKNWKEWWKKKGRYKKNLPTAPRIIHAPPKSKTLAEFVGIMLGDGGIAPYHISITLHREQDAEYATFVARLIRSLFKVDPKRYNAKSSMKIDLVVHRKALVDFCMSIGLPKGNKIAQNLDIPTWIKRNKKFSVACVRGLVDTDGSIFTHTYFVKGRRYNYKKLDFTSASRHLLLSVHTLMTMFGLHPRIAPGTRSLRLDRISDVERYFKIFSSNNPKHLKRYAR